MMQLSYGYGHFSVGSLHDYKDKQHKRVWDNRFTLYKLFNWIKENYNTEQHKIRNEGDKLALFTNDKKLWENFCGTFKDQISEIEPTDALNNNINVSPADYITPDAVVNMDDKLFNEYCNTDVFGTNQEKECISSLSDTKIPHRVNLN